MTRRLFMVSALLGISSIIFAQTPILPTMSFEQNAMPLTEETNGGLRYNGSSPLLDNPTTADTLWYSDFSSAGDWSINNQGAQGWAIGSTYTGWFYGGAIQSTSGGAFAEMNNGDPSGTTSAGTHILTSDEIDVSLATAGGFLMYQERASRFFDEMYIEASSDGTTWITIGRNLHLLPRTAANNTPGSLTDPEYVGYYIPAEIMTATGDLFVRFRWVDQNSGIAYGWMIDDVVVYQAPSFDLDIQRAYNYGATDSNAYLKYTMIPEAHAAAASFTPAGLIRAQGSGSHTGVSLDVSESNTGYSSSSNTFTLASGEFAIVETTDDFTTDGVGSYNLTYSMSFDTNDRMEENNEMSWEFEVTENEYAYDDDDFQGSGWWGGSGYTFCVYYDNFTETDVIGVKGYFPLASGSSGDYGLSYGDIVKGAIYTVVDGNLTEFGESVFHTVSGGNGFVDGWVDVPMNHTIPATTTEFFGCIGTLSDEIPMAYDYGVPGFAYVDSDNSGSFGRPITTPFDTFDVIPFVRVKTFNQDLCDGRTIIVEIDDECYPAVSRATLEADVTTSQPSTFTYAWSTDDATDTISITEEGAYSVTVTDADACTATASIDYLNSEFNCNLSVDDIDNSKADFTVVPNPSNGQFNLVFGNVTTDEVQIIVQSLKGDVLYNNIENVTSGANVEMNLGNLARGVYLVKVINDESTNVERIVIN